MEIGDWQVCIQCQGPEIPFVDSGAAQKPVCAQN